MTPTQHLLLFAIIVLAPHVSERFAIILAIISLIMATVFLIVE